LKPIDKVILGVISELPGRNVSERTGGLENWNFRKSSLHSEGKDSISKRKLAVTFVLFRRGGSDSMVTRIYQATGEALLVPRRNSWSR